MVQANKQQNVKDNRSIGSEIIDDTDRQIDKFRFYELRLHSHAHPVTCMCKFVMLLN